ncbi:MAG: hypothetical protein ACPKPY_05475 [Nitrososphaeraceae archaeon]
MNNTRKLTGTHIVLQVVQELILILVEKNVLKEKDVLRFERLIDQLCKQFDEQKMENKN